MNGSSWIGGRARPPKRWALEPRPPDEVCKALAGLDPLLVAALFHRGVRDLDSVRRFLSGNPEAAGDPLLMPGMEAALERIERALRSHERVAVYGDYDADGVTATAMLVGHLSTLGVDVLSYIPSRFDEGYGLNSSALRELDESGVRLVITVDCGVRSLEEAEQARRMGLDLIITDHHPPLEEIPCALAVVNPRLPASQYPDRSLAGVGVALKLVQALGGRLGRSELVSDEDLELVAVGTVADLAPLTGENRLLVRSGLARLNSPGGPRTLGLRALARVAGLRSGNIRASAIGFALGPRLNAAGRLETATGALRLLCAREEDEANRWARQLDQWNHERQDLTRAAFERARGQVEEARAGQAGPEGEPYFIVVADASYSPGVIGLVASRLTEEFYRPTAVIALEGELARGSARSIPDFHVTEALDQCGALLLRHGGHAAAAGFTLERRNLEALTARLGAVARRQLEGLPLEPVLRVDAEVQLGDLRGAGKWIADLEPCGAANPMPLWVARGVHIRERRNVGRDGAHLRLKLAQGSLVYDAIAFRRGDQAASLPESVDVAFTVEVGEYLGQAREELVVVDIVPAR